MKFPTRTCAKCQKPTLKPISRRFSGFGTAVQHRCTNCSAEIDITALASIGIVITVGLMALLFWGYILFHDSGGTGLFAQILYGFAVVGLISVTALPAYMNFKNPPVMGCDLESVASESTGNDAMKRAVIWVENAGFLGGLLLPILVVGAILSLAALIGFINFTYFGN